MLKLSIDEIVSGSWNKPISMRVTKGEVVILVGRNGSGKSTLLNTIAGLVPVKSGAILFDEKDITSTDQIHRSRLGITVALEGHRIFRRLSVRKNLMIGGIRRRDANSDADLDWVLSIFPSLKSRLNDDAWMLSGGMQTQLTLGRALMSRAQLLLLDEPTLGLDLNGVRAAIEIVTKLRDQGVSLIIAEQNRSFLKAFPEHIVLLVGGRIEHDGSWK
jgi:branched-chain amino acid transport system ATP-binding protein